MEWIGARLRLIENNDFNDSFLDDDYFRTFFLPPSFFPWGLRVRNVVGDACLPYDKRKIYRANNYGFRSDDFIEPADLVFAGCSYTYGSGLHEENIWGNILGKSVGMSTANLGIHGASWKMIVDNVIGYCELIGAPKKLACLFPDFYRYTTPVDGFIHRNDDRALPKTRSDQGGYFATISFDRYHEDVPNISKRPHDPDVVLSKDQAAFQSISAIRVLEQYCRTNKIDFSWTTWHNSTAKVIDLFAQKREETSFSNYFSLRDYYGYGYLKRSKTFTGYVHINDYNNECHNYHREKDCSCGKQDCHTEEEKLYESTGEFHHALDIEHDFESTHPGIHSHLHYIDGFRENLW